MKLIILDPRRGISHTLPLPRHWYLLVAALVLLLPALGAVGGYWYSLRQQDEPLLSGDVGRHAASSWRERIDAQGRAISEVRTRAEERLKAMTVRVAEMQARLLRLDALGERLVKATHVGAGDFDFSRAPAVGGPDAGEGAQAPFRQPDFMLALDELSEHIEAREGELKILESLLDGGRLREERFLAGNPVHSGYLSSTFGTRIDPFHGTLAFHKGIDFAGPEGADIVATGAGIVVLAGEQTGYGDMVEISHGDGISTVYAHASKVYVRVGDIVREGQPLARLGSTGRSTGPHVHYEVRRNGVPIDPATYLAAEQARAGGG